jgi:nucleoside-diphosphate-sugar epimerase
MALNIAVLGASSFIGRNLAVMAARKGHTVYGYSRFETAIPEVRWKRYNALGPPPDLPEGLDAVFYLIQSSHYRSFPEQADDLFGVNLMGAIKAAQTAKERGAGFFCYASTGSVYAPSFQALSENSALLRTFPYGLSKLITEEALDCFSPWLKTLSIRIFGAYGPGQNSKLASVILNKLITGESIYLAPSPGGDRDGLKISFIFNDDLAETLLRLVEIANAEVPLPKRLNLAGPEAISIRQLAEGLASLGAPAPIFLMAEKPRGGDLTADISLLKALVTPNFTPFHQGLNHFLAGAKNIRPKEAL